ncbi:MAG TPA: TetR family transcriptional regulator [Gemmatimonadales bacterium]|nr:TetR family transcriptional regulator [Gemmatimonadales bacterium]
MRRTAEESRATRERVLRAALRVFSRAGFSASRLEDIAREASVTRGAIYHHFNSKEGLYRALVAERSVGINRLAEAVVTEGGSPLETLRRLLTGSFTLLANDPEYRALLELTLTKVEFTEGLQSITAESVEGRRQLVAYLEKLLSLGIETGEFRSDLAVRPAAYAIVSFMNGVGLLWVQDPRGFSLRRGASSLVETFMSGLRPSATAQAHDRIRRGRSQAVADRIVNGRDAHAAT